MQIPAGTIYLGITHITMIKKILRHPVVKIGVQFTKIGQSTVILIESFNIIRNG